MWAKVTSIGLKGMEGYRVNVEVGTYVGTDSFRIVGLPDAAVNAPMQLLPIRQHLF